MLFAMMVEACQYLGLSNRFVLRGWWWPPALVCVYTHVYRVHIRVREQASTHAVKSNAAYGVFVGIGRFLKNEMISWIRGGFHGIY